MKISDLWRMRYDALLSENEKLKKHNKMLNSQLIATILALIVIFIYSAINIFY